MPVICENKIAQALRALFKEYSVDPEMPGEILKHEEPAGYFTWIDVYTLHPFKSDPNLLIGLRELREDQPSLALALFSKGLDTYPIFTIFQSSDDSVNVFFDRQNWDITDLSHVLELISRCSTI